MFVGNTLRLCVQHETAQASNGADARLRSHIGSIAGYSAALRKRLVTVQHEAHAVRTLAAQLHDVKAALAAPLLDADGGDGVTGHGSSGARHKATPRRTDDAAAAALRVEAEAAARCVASAAEASASLAAAEGELGAMERRIAAQLAALRSALLRDNECLTSVVARAAGAAGGDPSPRRPETTGGSRSGRIPRPPHLEKGSGTPRGDNSSQQHHAIRSSSSGDDALSALPPVAWPAAVDACARDAIDVVARCGALRSGVVQRTKELQQEAERRRAAVMARLAESLAASLRRRQELENQVVAVDRRLGDCGRVWNGAIDTVGALAAPMAVAAARQRLRSGVLDAVGHTLVDEAAALRRGRHDVKSLCRRLVRDMSSLQGARRQHLDDIDAVDAALRADRDWMTLENPLSSGASRLPRPPKVAAKRTYFHVVPPRPPPIGRGRSDGGDEEAPHRPVLSLFSAHPFAFRE